MRLYFLPSLLKPLALLALLGCGVLPLQTQPGRVEPLAVNLNKVPKDHGPLKRIVVERFEDESALQDPESVERLADDVRDELIRRSQAELDKVPSRFPEADWRRTE